MVVLTLISWLIQVLSGFETVFLLTLFSMLYSLEGSHYAHLTLKWITSISLRIEYLHNLFEILFHGRFVYFFQLLYSIIHLYQYGL